MDPCEESYHFKHFDTENQCTIYLYNNPQIHVAYKCCNGRGYATPVKNPPTQVLTKHKSQKHTDSNEDQINIIKGTCEICFTENKSLYSTCTCCKQPFCMDCLKRLPSTTCPYCRGTLTL